jgi:hypothetical protein
VVRHKGASFRFCQCRFDSSAIGNIDLYVVPPDASIGDYGIDSTESRFGGIICCNYGGLISCIHRHRNGLATDVPQFKTQIFKQCCSARGDDDICA